jgi:hypothetical protein
MALKTVKFETLTKGQFDSVNPIDVPNGGWAEASNFLPFNRRMNRRGGTRKFTLDDRDAAATTDVVSVIPVSGLAQAPSGLEDWALCTITRAGEVEFASPTGTWEGIVPSGSAATVGSDEMPWRMIVRNSRVYAVRRDGGRMRRIEGGVWRDAGRPAPGTKPTLAVAGSGSALTGGTYQVAYGYLDSETGYYGNPSPTEEIVVAPGEYINVTNLVGKSTAFFATQIVIYMSAPDGQVLLENPPSQVACPDAPTTTSTQIGFESTGAVAPTRNLQPAAGVTWVEEWGERFWWANGSLLHYSPVGEFESYSDIQAFEFEKGSGSDISVIYAWGNKLVVGKRRKMFLMAGFDRSSWEKKPWSTKIGCVAPHSMRNCEGQLIFKCEDGFAMSGEGEEPRVISTDSVATALEGLDRTREDLTYAEVWPEQSIYLALFPKQGEEWGGVVYNWRQKAWAVVDFPFEPRSLRLGYDSDGNTRLFAVMNSSPQVYSIFEGDTDDGAAIKASLTSGAPQLSEEGFLAAIHHIRTLAAKTRWPITVTIYGDGNLDTPIAQTTVTTEDSEGWNIINVDNLGDPRTQIQVMIEYEGRDPFWIAEWAWRIMPTNKHVGEF